MSNESLQNAMNNNHDVITVQKLSYSYDSKKALDDVYFSIAQGSYTAIVGSNGSGKSTLCRLICGLLPLQPDSGNIIVDPDKRIGLVFQSPKDQIVSSKVYRDTAFGPQNLKLSADEVELRTIECLSIVELLDKAEAPSNALSLGQTQKLALAGMLAVKPEILILDEAVAMLDPETRDNVYELLRNLHKKGNTIIHIAHDIKAVEEAQNVICLEQGRIFFNGTSKDFLASKENVLKVTGRPLGKNPRAGGAGRFATADCTFKFENVCFSYEKNSAQEAPLINNVSFELYKGTLTALTGVSGAGKSTLLELGAGILTPESGRVLCN